MTSSHGVQYVEPNGSNLKFALTSVANATANSNDLHMQMQFPQKWGWGSVAIGDQMAEATMFVVYPTTDGKSATFSVRTTSGDVQPIQLKGVDCKTQTMQTANSIVNAAFVCYGIGDDSRLKDKPASNWIWAVGPGGQQTLTGNRDDPTAALVEHELYGSFLLNMLQAKVAPAEIQPLGSGHTAHPSATGIAASPMITGSTSTGASSSGATTMPASGLIHAHAVILCGSFLILYPLSVFLLRLVSVRAHWTLNAFTTLLCVIGFGIAIGMSADSTEHDSFNTGHQVLGIMLMFLLPFQIALGTMHHVKYKRTGWGTWMAMPHLNLGRIIMLVGMIAGITGFDLSENTVGAVLYGLASALVVGILIAFIYWDRRKRANLTNEHGDDRPLEKLTAPQRVGDEVVQPVNMEQQYYMHDLPGRPSRPTEASNTTDGWHSSPNRTGAARFHQPNVFGPSRPAPAPTVQASRWEPAGVAMPVPTYGRGRAPIPVIHRGTDGIWRK